MSLLLENIQIAKELAYADPWHNKELSVLRVIPEEIGVTVIDSVMGLDKVDFYTWEELEKVGSLGFPLKKCPINAIVEKNLLAQQSVDFIFDSKIKEAEDNLHRLREVKKSEYVRIHQEFDDSISPYYDKIVDLLHKNINVVFSPKNCYLAPCEQGVLVKYLVAGYWLDYVVTWSMLKEIEV